MLQQDNISALELFGIVATDHRIELNVEVKDHFFGSKIRSVCCARQLWGGSGLQRGPRSSTQDVSDRLQLASRRGNRRQ
jgi:hypothetical protein